MAMVLAACFEIKIGADAAKFSTVRIAAYLDSADIWSEKVSDVR